MDGEGLKASLGATDLAMRHHLPADILSVSLTRPMFTRLCALDERSFPGKLFLKNLRRARGGTL